MSNLRGPLDPFVFLAALLRHLSAQCPSPKLSFGGENCTIETGSAPRRCWVGFPETRLPTMQPAQPAGSRSFLLRPNWAGFIVLESPTPR